MRCGAVILPLAAAILLLTAQAPSSVAIAAEDVSGVRSGDPKPGRDREIREIKAEIRRLERRVDELEGENRDLRTNNQQLQGQTTQATEKVKALETKVEAGPPPSTIQQALSGFWGDHRFVITGSAEGSYSYDRNRNINSFGAQFEPLFLYRLNDWILFEGEIEAKLPSDSESEFNLESAMAHVFLTDNLEVLAGKFFLPFGDFIEDDHPFWVNKFVTHPLPFREQDDGGLLPFTDLGVQLRGGATWGEEGQDLDYTIYASNGPRFPTDVPPTPGQGFDSPNNISVGTHSKAFGARVRVYPLPLSADIGRLELGASTYDGKWEGGTVDNAGANLDGGWLTAWGVDAAYTWNEFQARGEYLQTHRQLPSGAPTDNREGWYVQLSYQLSRLGVPYLDRTEILARYSAQNQRAVLADEVPTAPNGEPGDVSESTFVPHAREVALGLDYWITPSVVWKLEYDIELPKQGGYLITDPTMPGVPAPAPNDRAVMTQFAIGF